MIQILLSLDDTNRNGWLLLPWWMLIEIIQLVQDDKVIQKASMFLQIHPPLKVEHIVENW